MKANIRSIDLNLLVVLEALYDERNVTRAANRLALTQPTVSGMLKRLRGIFDDDLFVRTSHGIIPTPRAEVLIEPVREITATAQSLLVKKDFDLANEDFTAILCGSEYTLHTILSDLAGDILKLAPKAKVSLVLRPAGNTEALMSRGEIDFLVTVKETAVPGLPTELLYRDNLVCVSSYTAHSDGQRISLDTLCACSHVNLNPRGVPISKPIDTALSALGMTRNLTVDVPSYAAVFKAMQSAELIPFLPELMCKSANPVKRLQTELKTPMIEIVAQWHPRMANDARHIWLRERLLVAFQQITHCSLNEA